MPWSILPSPRHLSALASSSPIWRMGCSREEEALATGGAAACFHHAHSVCGATSPHTSAVTALHRRKTVPPEMSLLPPPLPLPEATPASPILSDTTGKPRESWLKERCGETSCHLSTPLHGVLAFHPNSTKTKLFFFQK